VVVVVFELVKDEPIDTKGSGNGTGMRTVHAVKYQYLIRGIRTAQRSTGAIVVARSSPTFFYADHYLVARACRV
jgi:hypothetical protein